MTESVVRQLMLKDWRLYRGQTVFSILAGLIGLGIVQFNTEATVVVGTVFFFIAIILVGAMLPLSSIVNERKNHNLAFVMSLPVSSIQYTTSKLWSITGIFLIPWSALVAAGVLMVVLRGFPHGVIPAMLILALLPWVGLAIITAAGLIGESEGWGIAANVLVQSSYGLTWFFISRVPEVMKYNSSPVVVWSPTDLKIMATEVAIIPVLLGITYFVQSRKRDFI
ncbi:MAG TPA: ABC-2 transporter permease [Bryobacteraceae bacterium]|nr:ABC-2 transporter permease [Bryobacteraceae bacterium]